jgi:GTP cyclohydrolase II
LFSYVDEDIRKKLRANKKLVDLDKNGQLVEPDCGNMPFISMIGPIPLPVPIEDQEIQLDWYAFVRRVELTKVLNAANQVEGANGEGFRELLQTKMLVNSVLVVPDFHKSPAPLVRIHSCCMTGDVFGSLRCECGPQLHTAFSQILQEGGGAVVYMSSHEGRGIGLWAKAATYLLQDDGQDTYEANVSLGLPEDSRNFRDAAVVLRYLLKGKPIRLLSNNPLKEEHLVQGGQAVNEVVPLLAGVGKHNIRYMRSKKSKGHLLPEL